MTYKTDHTIFKTQVLKNIILLTASIVLGMAIYRFTKQQYLQSTVDMAMIIIFALMYIWITKVPSAYNIASRAILFVGLITILSAQFYDPRHIWFPPLILLAFFLRGRREGWIWLFIIAFFTTPLYLFYSQKAHMPAPDFIILLSSLFFIAIIVDWYERNKETILNKVKQANSYLEQRVQRRTEEVEDARIEAVDALRARSEFLANMSHEIRTPLNAINGFISLLKEDEEDLEKKEYFEIIQHASHSLVQTINDILDYSKIESKKTVLVNAPFDVIELKETIKLFEAKAREKEITLHYDCSSDLPEYLNGDIQKIRQTMNNLLSNAIKFTPNRGDVTCRLDYHDEHLYVSVQDSGVGIPHDKLESIFDPFTQADGSTAREFGGTGLGLAICSSFVEMMGGALKVESQPDTGSRFFFDLPLKRVTKQLDNRHGTNEHVTLKGHILLAEDNKANQLFMGLLLSNLGLKYDIAPDGLAAVEMMAKDHHYTIILMDEHMPHMSGIEATRQILKMERARGSRHTPIIALTANALSGDKERFLAAGMDDYISKPVNVEDMIELLKKYSKEEDV